MIFTTSPVADFTESSSHPQLSPSSGCQKHPLYLGAPSNQVVTIAPSVVNASNTGSQSMVSAFVSITSTPAVPEIHIFRSLCNPPKTMKTVLVHHLKHLLNHLLHLPLSMGLKSIWKSSIFRTKYNIREGRRQMKNDRPKGWEQNDLTREF